MRKAPLLLFAVAALAAAPRSDAAYMVFDGNVPQTDQNVLNSNDAFGMTIQGALNQSGELVNFASTTQFLAGPANGQARVEGRDGNNINSAQVDINGAIAVSLANPNKKFGSLIFNAFSGTGSFTLSITGVNSDNTPANAVFSIDDDSDPLALSNGSNFYTVVASGGMLMTSVSITPGGGASYRDLRQVRVGGIVPEPAALGLAVMASPLAWCAVRRRRS